jgi:predicted nuclease with TOPRIM domain
MTKEELREKLQELSKKLTDVQEDVEDIPNAAISEIDELINGKRTYYSHTSGLDDKIQEIIDGLDGLADEEIEDAAAPKRETGR